MGCVLCSRKCSHIRKSAIDGTARERILVSSRDEWLMYTHTQTYTNRSLELGFYLLICPYKSEYFFPI